MKNFIKKFLLKTAFVPTLRALKLDLQKFFARTQTKKMVKKYIKINNHFPKKLHFGCGKRKKNGWLNIDVADSDINIDFSVGKLPFSNKYFELILSQHVIEHLEIKNELEPIFKEFFRILNDDGLIYLSCPCIKKISKAYLDDGGKSLYEARQKRFKGYSLDGYPYSQVINELFNQSGYHKNLFDLNLLKYCLNKSGFNNVQEITEKEFLYNFPEFDRNDNEQTLYVKVSK